MIPADHLAEPSLRRPPSTLKGLLFGEVAKSSSLILEAAAKTVWVYLKSMRSKNSFVVRPNNLMAFAGSFTDFIDIHNTQLASAV